MPEGPALKDRFTALDTLALVREIRGLARARVDKAFDLPDGGIALSLRVPREGRQELLLVPGRYAALRGEAADHSEELGPLAKDLRRWIAGAIVVSAADPKSERYLEIALVRGGDEVYTLALEFFGTGNIVLARAGRIVAVARARAWAHRILRPGADYVRPPERGNPWAMSAEEIGAELRRSRNDLASTLAARLSLGGPVAEEVLARSGLSGATPASSVEEVAPLHRAIAAIVAEIADPPRGYLYERDGEPIDATPYPSLRWGSDPTVRGIELPRFSDAAARYFATLAPSRGPAPPTAAEKERANLERQLERQRAAVVALETEARDRVADGQALLTHFGDAETRLRAIPGVEGAEGDPVPIEVGGRTVGVRRDLGVRGSAQALFEEGKRLRAKLAGARGALAETEARLARPAEGPAAPKRRGGVAPESGPEHWFERFRWFISSDGFVVVAGRDAATNDRVVRRHLRDGDIYAHADLHGAASVIVKSRGPGADPPPATTLREAAAWAVAFSKAWRAGLASASAFWVAADQVSKTPATGEFVARGAWVIHGTKHFERDLPLELALGRIRYEGSERWTVAPPSAVRALGEPVVLLTPGEERERSEREIELSRETGLSRSRLQGMLPAGGLNVRRP